MLSTLWIAILIGGLFRDVHEILRPGFVDELAHQGTNYGREVTDGLLLGSGLVLMLLISVVFLARVLPRRPNRIVNFVATGFTTLGTLAIWPKDPDDIAFGLFQLAGVALVVAICVRWPQNPQNNDTPALGDPERSQIAAIP